MKIIDGKKIADRILADLKEEIKKKKLKPSLAVILVGDNPVSLLYVQKKEQAAQKIGIEIRKYNLSKQTSEKEILDLIDSLNDDRQVNGILVQLSLPNHLATDKIIQAIRPAKDVDGFVKNSRFKSPFILAVERALQETGRDLIGKKAVALVNSDIFGQALKSQLKKLEFIKDLKKADIIITALGQPQIIKGEMIKPGVILIDGGISKTENKIFGDVDKESVQEKAGWLAPVPGGVGPLTVAFLLKNVVLAAKK